MKLPVHAYLFDSVADFRANAIAGEQCGGDLLIAAGKAALVLCSDSQQSSSCPASSQHHGMRLWPKVSFLSSQRSAAAILDFSVQT
jgi:hypothetical protein